MLQIFTTEEKNCCHYPELEIRIADFLLLPAMNLSDRNAIVSEIFPESAFVVWLATDRRRLRKANFSERCASPWSLYRSPFSWVIYCRFISDPVQHEQESGGGGGGVMGKN